MESTHKRLAVYVPKMLLGGRASAGAQCWQESGSLLFCDVSGFTRLSEKLARRGKIGAEELVTNLSTIYGALLAATDDGGDVLKFSGDAMVIFFSGEDHALRAAHAAHGMRRALRDVGSITTSQGRVRLRMSTGVHSGDFHFFACGEDHLELLAAGPGVSATVAMEAAADAGEVLLSPTTAAALPPGALGTEKAGGILLRRPPALPPMGAGAHPDVPDSAASRFVPRLLRERLVADGSADDHRQVTIAFLQFQETDALLASEGAQGVFERLQELTCTVQRVTERYGVCTVATDIDANGGKFMLVSGAPEASEDADGRMLRAALDILAEPLPLPVRIGVNRGHVFAGDVGATHRRTYSTMGDATNLAARIMGKTGTGQLYAHRDVLAHAAGRFKAAPVPPFMVKGKSITVHASRVDAALPDFEGATTTFATPFVGREEEVSALRSLLLRCGTGPGAAVELIGEAGVGKTRLLTEVLEPVGDRPILHVGCNPYSATAAYSAARVLLRQALGIPLDASREEATPIARDLVERFSDDLEPFAALLNPVLAVDLEPSAALTDLAERFRAARMHALASRLCQAAVGAAVLVIDDAGLMDDASAVLLAHILRTIDSRPWLAIVARRWGTGGLHSSLDYGATRLQLTALPAQDARELIEAASDDRPLRPRTRQAIIDRGGGNPLFLLELVEAAQEGSTLPSSVEAIIASRIDRLDPRDREALRSLSVLGPSFTAELIDRVLGDDGITADDATFWARLSGFVAVEGPGAFSFRSEVHRDVAYEGLTFSARRALHGKVADLLLAEESGEKNLPALALHYARAELHESSWVYGCLAGDEARDASAHAEAAEAYGRALESAQHLPHVRPEEMAAVAERRGDALSSAGHFDVAAAAYRAARKLLPPSTAETPRLLLKEGVANDHAGRYIAALRWCTKGLKAADDIVDDGARGPIKAQLAVECAAIRFRQGRLPDAVRWASRAVDEAERVCDTATLANAYYLLDAAWTGLGDPRAEEVRHLPLELYIEIGDLLGQGNVLNNLGVAAYYEGDWVSAFELYRRSREAFRRVGDDVAVATASNNIAEILSDQGRHEEAEALLREARGTFRATGYRIGAALATSNLGRLHARTGQPEAGLERLRSALQEFLDIGADPLADETRARMAEAYLAMGRPVEAWEAATEALVAGRAESGWALAATAERLRGLALIQGNGVARGLECLRGALGQARELRAEYEVALCLDALARHDEHDRPERRAEAARIFARLGVRAPVGVEISDGADALRVDVVADDREREEAHAPTT